MGFKTSPNPFSKGGEGEISFRFRVQNYYKYLECARFFEKNNRFLAAKTFLCDNDDTYFCKFTRKLCRDFIEIISRLYRDFIVIFFETFFESALSHAQ